MPTKLLYNLGDIYYLINSYNNNNKRLRIILEKSGIS